MKRITVALMAMCLGVVMLVGAASPASATTRRCERQKPAPDGYVTCYEATAFTFKTVRVESVPVRNYTKVRIHATCRFTQTVTKTIEGAATFGVSGKASLFKVVEIGSNWSVSVSLSQTKTQATEVAGDFWLNPGQAVTCIRTYGYVSAKIKSYDRWDVGGQVRNVKTATVKVPSSLGVDFI